MRKEADVMGEEIELYRTADYVIIKGIIIEPINDIKTYINWTTVTMVESYGSDECKIHFVGGTHRILRLPFDAFMQRLSG